ncbi:MAG: hypothetical protein DMF56_26990 [Acidobacteria bacterium]|nr:MAG: hypothetical protein DMF56_26990 [Acidobacteriota bacterium]
MVTTKPRLKRTPDRVRCPDCLAPLRFIGAIGLTLHDRENDAQADRYDCPNGHTVLTISTDRIE